MFVLRAAVEMYRNITIYKSIYVGEGRALQAMTTRQARHKRAQWRGKAPQAALLLTLGHRIEAVQFIRSATCYFVSGTPEDGGRRIRNGKQSRDVIVAKLPVQCCYSSKLSLSLSVLVLSP